MLLPHQPPLLLLLLLLPPPLPAAGPAVCTHASTRNGWYIGWMLQVCGEAMVRGAGVLCLDAVSPPRFWPQSRDSGPVYVASLARNYYQVCGH